MKAEELLANVFGVAVHEVTDATSPEQIEEWDSLGHMNLVMEIERVYGIELSTDDALEITDVASLKRVLTARGARC
jgi:acyl carrier protein